MATTSCGPEAAVCSTRIYAKEVVQSVRQEMKSLILDPNIPVQVPTSMELDETMKSAHWKDAAMVELRIHPNNSVQEVDVLRCREMISKHSVKETGVDDEGLAEFSNNYYGKYPLYCDKSYSLYQALGDRKAVELPSLFTLFTSFLDAWRRVTSKGIGWNVKGEGIVKGGLIIFDAQGNPRYAYKEVTGVDLPVQDIVKAVEAVRADAIAKDTKTNLVIMEPS